MEIALEKLTKTDLIALIGQKDLLLKSVMLRFNRRNPELPRRKSRSLKRLLRLPKRKQRSVRSR